MQFNPKRKFLAVKWLICLTFLTANFASRLMASTPAELEAVNAETMHAFHGANVHGIDVNSLAGKVMCGYQGWFNAEGDGAGRSFHHWTKDSGLLQPGNAKIDLWPDVSELAADERFPTGFLHADGRTAEVFSSFKEATVLRHFQWMRDYGIDGVFVQRFATPLRDARGLRHNNVVLTHCRKGANRFGRAYAVMYDLSGLGENQVSEVANDWRALRTQMHITEDPAYLQHRGKPVVAVWGVGFNKDRKYSIAECRQLVEFLKKDDCTVMLGVPNGWRELNRDSVADPELHEVLKLADIVSPWTVGRYDTVAEAKLHGNEDVKPDLAWCRAQKLDYLPVVFPGFSWFNMQGKAFNKIPRLKGEFLWSQFVVAKQAGAEMIYVAMFDEVDEGTAIFKCQNDVPVSGKDKFVTYEGLPSDFYLKITEQGGRLLRGEMQPSEKIPHVLAPLAE
jgi:hypothetical protein